MRWIKKLWPTLIPTPWDIWGVAVQYGPALVAVLSMMAGYVQHMPIMWIIMAGAVTFAALSHGALVFSSWRYSRAVENKLVFSHVIFYTNIDGSGIGLGFNLLNKAHFPIQFDLISLKTQIGDQVPRQSNYDVRSITVPPQSSGWFHDHAIDIQSVPSPGTREGMIEFEIKYGRPGRTKYVMKDKKQVLVEFDENGSLKGGIWNNAV